MKPFRIVVSAMQFTWSPSLHPAWHSAWHSAQHPTLHPALHLALHPALYMALGARVRQLVLALPRSYDAVVTRCDGGASH